MDNMKVFEVISPKLLIISTKRKLNIYNKNSTLEFLIVF
jgi:hypothetical protein